MAQWSSDSIMTFLVSLSRFQVGKIIIGSKPSPKCFPISSIYYCKRTETIITIILLTQLSLLRYLMAVLLGNSAKALIPCKDSIVQIVQLYSDNLFNREDQRMKKDNSPESLITPLTTALLNVNFLICKVF